MPKFRKKPVVIEAEQWFPGKKIEGVFGEHEGKASIVTLEGQLRVSPGDWIITGVNGEKYPCKPDIFEKTYEPVFIGEDSDGGRGDGPNCKCPC